MAVVRECYCMCEFTQDSWKMYRYALISGNIIKEMPGSVPSGTHCT
jgi:hypothetical protein